MPHHPRKAWALDMLLAVTLTLALVFSAPQHALAAKSKATPKPTALPQPTRDPSAEPYDESRPDLLEPDMLIATSAILVEASTGDIVFEKNADQVLYPASTTKIMTALLTVQAMRNEDMPTTVTISANAANQPDDGSLLKVVEGDEINIKDLLYGMMLRSGNDAATALAEHISGSVENFVTLMNDTADFLGCTNTHFANPHGYHDPNHYTTARDLSIIARAAMDFPLFRDVVSTVEYDMPDTKHPGRHLVTNDVFINNVDDQNKYYYPDAIGIKSGFHSEAMACFVGAAQRDGVELISVVLFSSDKGRWVDTKRLMEYGFSQFESTTPEEIYEKSPRTLNISGFDLTDAKHLGELTLGIRPVDPQSKVTLVGRKDDIAAAKVDFMENAQIRITGPDRAPITKGEVMGYLTYKSSNGPVDYELYATRSIAARKDAPPSLAEIEKLTQEDPNPFPRFSLEFLVVPLTLVAMLYLLIRLLLYTRRRAHDRKQKKRIPLPKTRSYH